MVTITSCVVALLANPESSNLEPTPIPEVVLASDRFLGREFHGRAFELQTVQASPEPRAIDSTTESDDGPAALREDLRHPLDKYPAITVVQMKNMAGSPVPTTLRYAFDQRPPIGLLGDTYVRRHRVTARGGGPEGSDGAKWQFALGGFLAAPFRVGYGERLQPTSPNAPGPLERSPGQSRNSLHLPLVPDDQYLSYGYTQHNPRDWAELYLSLSNGIVTGTVAVQGNNFTDANFRDDTQLGVSQAFLTLTPKLKARWARLFWRIGSFQARYGASGRYDAGELQTYLFAQTHTIGEVGQLDILIKDFTLTLEHGIGTHRPDPNASNSARFSFVHHAHAGFSYRNRLWLNLHWISQFAREELRDGVVETVMPGDPPPPESLQKDGSLLVVGPELKLDWGRWGWWYFGFSYIKFTHGEVLTRGVEVIHSSGVGEFNIGLMQNYFYGFANRGEIFSTMFQVEESIMKIKKGSAWYGQGRDFVVRLFGMINQTQTDVNDTVDGIWKVKYGADLEGIVTPWLTVAFRATQVRPNHRNDKQTFSIFSPRLAFHTNFVTHETIELQYSRYLYNTPRCDPTFEPSAERDFQCVPPSGVMPEGFGTPEDPNVDPLTRNRASPSTPGYDRNAGTVGQPDENVFMLMINMWF